MLKKQTSLCEQSIAYSYTFLFCALVLLTPLHFFAQDEKDLNDGRALSDSELIDRFINAQGYSKTILFDSSNIKQYWTNNDVISKDDSIIISCKKTAKGWESEPLSIMLANVDESLDCRIDVISSESNMSFSISNSKKNILSKSIPEDDYILYHINSSSFHLENAKDFVFNLHFISPLTEYISIKKIVLSFSNNSKSLFLGSPGTTYITKEMVSPSSTTNLDNDLFDVSGKRITLNFKKNVIVKDNETTTSVTIQNKGNKPAKCSVGYSLFSKDGARINSQHFPYKNINKVLTVVSSEKGSNIIIVDSYPEWAKKCRLARNAKDDLSDIPNRTFVPGRIQEIKQLSGNMAEITLDEPLEQPLDKGEKIRIQGFSSSAFYTNAKVVKPGEEETIIATARQDDNYLKYDPDSGLLPRGVYYVRPIILGTSSDPETDSLLHISEYIVSY